MQSIKPSYEQFEDEDDEDVSNYTERTQLLTNYDMDFNDCHNLEYNIDYTNNTNNTDKFFSELINEDNKVKYDDHGYTIEENYLTYDNPNNIVNYSGFETTEEIESQMVAQMLDYDMNYTLKQLEHILAYYDIPKKRMNKQEIIETIIQIENNTENTNVVLRRKEMFKYADILKKDKYFSKFMLFSY